MNIFATSQDPLECARILDDKRVQKMLLESIQMLGNAVYLIDKPLEFLPKRIDGMPYAKAHYNHPCSAWVRESEAHYEWLHNHAVELAHECFGRKNQTPDGTLVARNLSTLFRAQAYIEFPTTKFLGFQNSSAFKDLEVHEAYRQTMVTKWIWTDRRQPKWTNAEPPVWLKEAFHIYTTKYHVMDQPKWTQLLS